MKPYEGAHVWIWEVGKCEGGDARAIAEKARRCGVRGVLVKYHEGGGPQQFRDPFLRALPVLKATGLVVGAWGYIYHNHPEKEAAMALEALASGADWYVADVEAEVERAVNNGDLAKRFLGAIREGMPGACLGYSSFAYPSRHSRLPYRVYDSLCDVALPQVYWATIGTTPAACLARSAEDHSKIGLTLPIAPAGQAYDLPGPGDIVLFRSLVAERGYPGYSLWSWQHMKPEYWEALKMPVSSTTPAPALPTLKKGMAGGAVPLLAAILGLRKDVFDDALDGAVRDYQRQHGLVVDAIVGPKTWGSLIEELLVSAAEDWETRAQAAEEKLARVREIVN